MKTVKLRRGRKSRFFFSLPMTIVRHRAERLALRTANIRQRRFDLFAICKVDGCLILKMQGG